MRAREATRPTGFVSLPRAIKITLGCAFLSCVQKITNRSFIAIPIDAERRAEEASEARHRGGLDEEVRGCEGGGHGDGAAWEVKVS